MTLVQNNNPNLYHFAGILYGRFILIPIVAFEIESGLAFNMNGRTAEVMYDKLTGLIHRQGVVMHVDEYVNESKQTSESGVFADDNNGL